MAKAKTQYACTECGGTSNKWAGQCPACGQWNTMVESVMEAATNRFAGKPQGLVQGAPVMRLTDIEASVNSLQPPLAFADQLYVLREHIALVRRQFSEIEKQAA
jgi:predicted ATP-dependent serine protease